MRNCFPGILILLGLVATVFLVFSESVELLRLGLMAAVWAAVIASFAMTRYRRDSDLEKSKVEDLQTVYRLQLEREISARREYELGVETRVRREVGAEAEELAGLRDELAALRRNLEFLFEGGLPAERVALRAERVTELAASESSSRESSSSPGTHSNEYPAPRPPVYGAHEAAAPRFASPDDEPVTAETAAIDLGAKRAATTPAEDEPPVEDAVPATDDPDLPVSRRRRRAVDNDELGPGTTGLSVAQILANLAAEKAAAEQSTPDR